MLEVGEAKEKGRRGSTSATMGIAASSGLCGVAKLLLFGGVAGSWLLRARMLHPLARLGEQRAQNKKKKSQTQKGSVGLAWIGISLLICKFPPFPPIEQKAKQDRYLTK